MNTRDAPSYAGHVKILFKLNHCFLRVVDEQMRHIKDAEEEFLFREGDEVPTFRSTYNLYNYQNLDKIEKYINQVK